ncbi:MAG TPA: hypothetical protein VHA33_05475 [Candidatus Angelobacter sp.]|jgi:hypothetical protein|nr:hypothetical protein [Candidatus Angelobacter sp.]
MGTQNNALTGFDTSALALGNTNLGADLTAAGSDFGDLIMGVGNAVAATQMQLTTTSAATANALANATVNVIAVQETIYDDQGNITDAKSFSRILPLIDFIDPAFYQWTQVRLQGQFFVSELATSSRSDTHTFSDQIHFGQHGLHVILGGGNTHTGTQSDTASAVGRARMYAQLNPRTDVGVPKPTHVVRGPSLTIVQGEIKDVPGGGAPITGRTMSMLLQLRKIDGTPISGKSISVETDGTPFSFTAASTTGADGNLAIQLQRTFLPVPAGAPPGTTVDTSPKEIVVTARLGLVANSVTVTF